MAALLDRMRQKGGGCDGAENKRWPPWLKPLLSTSFFGQCKMHADAHKSECNMYCLDCMNGALCSQCLAYHRDHHAIQVSRAHEPKKKKVAFVSVGLEQTPPGPFFERNGSSGRRPCFHRKSLLVCCGVQAAIQRNGLSFL
jgi:hypothetical protein